MNSHVKKFLAGLALGSVVVAFAISVTLASKHIAQLQSGTQLAQIIAIETSLLKKWQESGALRQTLAYDSEGPSVSLLQRMLSQDPIIYPEKKITGYYGDNTKNAVINFQKDYSLPVTGEVDEITLKKLNEIFLSSLCPEPEVVYPDLLMRKIQRTNKLPLDYVPAGLEEISKKVRTAGIACLRPDVTPHLVRMFADASRDGVELMVTSGYRKPEIQKYLYDFWIEIEGPGVAEEIAEPGVSEHQLGSTVDLTDASIGYAGVDYRFESSRGGAWLAEHAHTYGFILSYPEHKRNVTGFSYEPWHWRYVGADVASELKSRRLVYNEANFDKVAPPRVADSSKSLALSARAFISVYVDKTGKETILIEQNKDLELPIASMTKLTVALVASDEHAKNDTITISTKALSTKGQSGLYKAGDRLRFSDALRALLIASHNEVASSLANDAVFIEQMNAKASALGLKHTHFVNPTGLDPVAGSELINESTVYDMYLLARHAKERYGEVMEITTEKNFDLSSKDGRFISSLVSTNKLLSDSEIPFKILGAKTGETPRAKQNLVLITESPCGGMIISAVIASTDSFADMKKLLQYDNGSFNWACLR